MYQIRVFISYSHENEIWLQESLDKKQNPRYLLGLWERALRNQQVVFWHDRDGETGLRGGDRWRTRILEEIDRADVAILLVTQDFIVSPFIRDVELPRILTRGKQGSLEILPVLLEPARWKELEIHGMFQLTPGNPTPLSEYFETSDHEWKKARIEVLEALERTLARVRERKGGPVSEPTQPEQKTAVSPEVAPLSAALDDAISARVVRSETAVPELRTTPSSASVRVSAPERVTSDDRAGHLANAAKVMLGTRQESVLPPPPKGPSPDVPPVQHEPGSYARIDAIHLVDSAGAQTTLSEFGVVYNLYAGSNLANATKDGLIIERGDATQKIPWGLIERVILPNLTAATITLRDGKALGPVKVRSGSIVGHDERFLDFTLPMENLRHLTLIRDASVSELDALIRDIPAMAGKTPPNAAWTCNLELARQPDSVEVTLGVFLDGKLHGSQVFSMPGPHKFWAVDCIVGVKAKEYFNLGPFNDEGSAHALADALNRLNTLLSTRNPGNLAGDDQQG